MGIRFVLSTVAASGIDSSVFSVLAFYGVMSNIDLFNLIITMWFIKVFIEICGLPISLTLAKSLKAAERLDIYDRRTKFNIFSLNTIYQPKDNEFNL